MERPEGWDTFDDRWFIRKVMIKPDRWLLMFLRHNNEHALPVGWINITRAEWHPENTAKKPNDAFYIREHQLMQGSLLELSCIEREWTQEILDGLV